MPTIHPDRLAYWFLRLNGFLTTVNFVVHPEQGADQRTDADVIGVRFAHRAELGPLDPMPDDARVTNPTSSPLILIAEAKRGWCDLNGPWTDPDAQNMQRILRALGAFREGEVEDAANTIYEVGAYRTESIELRLACFGARANLGLSERYPEVIQLEWGTVLQFIYHRFASYSRQKSSHSQWDRDGHALWDLAQVARTADAFVAAIEVEV